nr:tyrosine-type recombinase/integrase [Kibdelosporangium sp. MJ126-NF4]CEL16584.1 Mobile element protein [Kibdelosporangium sp. MJ126-NF4]CTQ89065.1 Mobile element protein [Kibdelosporangium sp. MJ126-NF4]
MTTPSEFIPVLVTARSAKRTDRRDPRLPVAHLFSEDKARRLWEAVPDPYRLDHFDSANMPPLYDQAFVGHYSRSADRVVKAVTLRDLPTPMIWELCWFIHQEVINGGMIDRLRFGALRQVLLNALRHGSAQARAARSVTALTPDDWLKHARRGLMHLTPATRKFYEQHTRGALKRCQDRLAHAYHDGQWWQLDVWNPAMDTRIPVREHEPNGRHVTNFSRLNTEWLREGAKWWLGIALSSGQYTWSTLKTRVDSLKWLERYIDQIGCAGPQLVADPHELRPWVRGFLETVRQHRVVTGPTKGKPLGMVVRRQINNTVEAFYRFMYDHREEAATALAEPRWRLLEPHYCAIIPLEYKPRRVNKLSDDLVLEDEVVSQIAAGSGALAAPKSEGGIGDIQAFHALMLLLRTGRRLHEILLMDFDPLKPLLSRHGHGEDEGDEFVARMTYQLTKTSDGPAPSIPVDAEIVQIVRAQQQWAQQFMVDQGAPEGTIPQYLFLRTRGNRLGKLPYSAGTLPGRLRVLTELLSVTDSVGRPVAISKTHRFRHTRATSLINAGVPIHVVMRYLGHITPTMTLHYAKTLAETAEREFLRFKKVTADGRQAAIDPSDLYDLLALQKRADRVLPNGWCMLPPKQVCTKGNACLSCEKWVTDQSHRDELVRQLDQTEALVDQRQTQFAARYGEPMGEDNVWLAGRLAETTALRKVLVALDQVAVLDGDQMRAVRGAGVPDRPESTPEQSRGNIA